MRKHSDSGPAGGDEPAASRSGTNPVPALRMSAHITAAEALAAFQRKIPGANAEVRAVFHPFWWTPLTVHTRGLLRRRAHGRGQRMDILVNAVSGRGMIADFTPAGEVVPGQEWADLLGADSAPGHVPSRAAAERTARALARTKVLKTVKLGMDIDLSAADDRGARRVLKPNWLVTGGNTKYAATILVDGLDASHYIVRVEKLSPSSSHR